MEKIFLYIPRDAFEDNVSHICLKSKSNHLEKLLISLAIYKWGIFCQKLFRVFKIKVPKQLVIMLLRNLKTMKSKLNGVIEMCLQIELRINLFISFSCVFIT